MQFRWKCEINKIELSTFAVRQRSMSACQFSGGEELQEWMTETKGFVALTENRVFVVNVRTLSSSDQFSSVRLKPIWFDFLWIC